jgi:hypothetical protein
MDKNTDILHEAKRLRLLAAALELQHLTGTASNVVPIPNTGRSIVIGTPAEVVELLPELRTAVPAAWVNFARSIADLPAGAEPNLAGMRAKARQLVDREDRRVQEGGVS